jgi:hypothetical protein
MSINFTRLNIEKVIIHEITRQALSDQKTPPHYSEIESPINDDIKLFLKDKVITTIGGSRSHEVIFDDDSNSPIPEIVKKLLDDDSDFVLLSKTIANHLNKIQSGRSPGGLVTIVIANIQNRKVVGILKLEREEGARLEQTQREGRLTYDILHLRDLILTEKTKLFKIGLFFNEGLEEFGYEGKICDNQLSFTPNKEVAAFFLTSFLGCRLAGDPRVETKEFFISSQKFIKEKIEDPILQIKYNLHLLSYISNERRVINPRIFARANIGTTHQQQYINHLEENGIKIADIIRDTSLIEHKINKMILEFENGIKIIGNQESFDEKVSLEAMEDGRTRAEVVSRMKNIRT